MALHLQIFCALLLEIYNKNRWKMFAIYFLNSENRLKDPDVFVGVFCCRRKWRSINYDFCSDDLRRDFISKCMWILKMLIDFFFFTFFGNKIPKAKMYNLLMCASPTHVCFIYYFLFSFTLTSIPKWSFSCTKILKMFIS